MRSLPVHNVILQAPRARRVDNRHTKQSANEQLKQERDEHTLTGAEEGERERERDRQRLDGTWMRLRIGGIEPSALSHQKY